MKYLLIYCNTEALYIHLKKNWDLVSIFDDIREGLKSGRTEKDERQKAWMKYPRE